MRRTDWKRVSLSGVMQLFGVICIKWIERLMAGINHQHVLSYNPTIFYVTGDSIGISCYMDKKRFTPHRVKRFRLPVIFRWN